jgi:hypothetical protein
MKKLIALWCFVVVSTCQAADGVGLFQSGLQAFRENGPTALLNAWYGSQDDGERIAKIRDRLAAMTRALGPVVDTEVFAPRNLGPRVQRLYGVIYFEKRPLWLRAEHYDVGGRSGFISLEFSLSPEEILPIREATLP